VRRSYRRRKRRVSRGMLIVLLLLVTVFMVSCVAGSDPLWIREVFGLDVVHYDEEPALHSCATDGEIANSLSCIVGSLTTARSLSLPTFDSSKEGVSLYRDAILNDLLREHYLLYTGNPSTLSDLSSAYPGRTVTTLIPESDFESAAVRYFGTGSVRHKNGTVFEYLDRVDGYTAPLQAWETGTHVQVEQLEETEHTFRMTFRLSDGEDCSIPYRAVFAKREGGSCYLYSLVAA